MSFIVVIPARQHSTRLPNKLLADIGGKTMLERTFLQAKQSDASRIVIATDSQEILEIAQKFGAEAHLTSPNHQSGTARIAQVVEILELDDETIVVNVQGDEPMLPPQLINQVANSLAKQDNPVCPMATLCEPIEDYAQYLDENCVKVVRDEGNYALYFSRAPIPYFRNKDEFEAKICYLHIGLYAYNAGFLRQENSYSSYEQAEKLEQLNTLQAGFMIYVDEASCKAGVGVDTQAGLDKVRKLLKNL